MFAAGGLLSGVLSMFGGQFIEKLTDGAIGLVKQFMENKITKEQLQDQLLGLVVSSARDIEISHSETLAKTYESFQQTLRGSVILQSAWVALFISQTIVMLWYQLGVPALCYSVGDTHCYPSAGGTVDWANAMLLFMLGAGPIVLRQGESGGGGIVSKLKSLIK